MHHQIKKIYHYFHLETQSDRKTLVKKKKLFIAAQIRDDDVPELF